MVAFGTWVTRFSPFLLFVHKRDGKLPDIVTYLGEVLPAAVMGMLVVYALKDVSLITWPNGIPEGLALIVTVGVHLYKKNFLISMFVGTLCYMVLVQTVFL
ncbi:MAG: AzlD domain-containing protein [Megasphaera micronuciformis]|nr:AzlD domain-containing protein [Megasphaera micronuciformis]